MIRGVVPFDGAFLLGEAGRRAWIVVLGGLDRRM